MFGTIARVHKIVEMILQTGFVVIWIVTKHLQESPVKSFNFPLSLGWYSVVAECLTPLNFTKL